jgi:hypothetical protein
MKYLEEGVLNMLSMTSSTLTARKPEFAAVKDQLAPLEVLPAPVVRRRSEERHQRVRLHAACPVTIPCDHRMPALFSRATSRAE